MMLKRVDPGPPPGPEVLKMAERLYDAAWLSREGTCWSDEETIAIMGADQKACGQHDAYWALRVARRRLDRIGIYLVRIRWLGWGLVPAEVGAFFNIRAGERLFVRALDTAVHALPDDLTPSSRVKRLRTIRRARSYLRAARQGRKRFQRILARAFVD